MGMIRRSVTIPLALALGVAPVLLASCSSGSSNSSSTTQASSSNCSKSVLDKASGPITINFWNSMPRANGVELQKLTDQFNSSQSKIHVNLVNQSDYDTTFQKYKAGLSNGQLPDVVQLQDTDTQAAIDTQSFTSAQSCFAGFNYKLGDLLPQATSYYTINKNLWAMPFSVSAPVLYYNTVAFKKAGIANPPATLAEMTADAKTLHAAGVGGMGFKMDPWSFWTWLGTENSLFANSNNGRTARATAVTFNNSVGTSVFTSLSQMVAAGDSATNAYTGSSVYDNLLGIGSGKYSMTIDTSAALGTIEQLLSSGQYPNVGLGVAPFPPASAGAKGGVAPAGNALWISSKSSPAKQSAAFEFISYLDSTDSQTAWAAGTGYIPLRASSAQSKTIQDLWNAKPYYKVAYTSITSAPQSYATSGPVIGPFADVRTALASAEASMFVNGTSPEAALKAASAASDAAITSYDQRLGVN